MTINQLRVREFIERVASHQELRTTPGIPIDADLRARLIIEDALETVAALVGDDRMREIVDGVKWDSKYCTKPDIIEVADGLADLEFVLLGAACGAGIDLEPIFAEVYRTNMEKGQGLIVDGKRMKPLGWKKPDIAALLMEQNWKGKP